MYTHTGIVLPKQRSCNLLLKFRSKSGVLIQRLLLTTQGGSEGALGLRTGGKKKMAESTKTSKFRKKPGPIPVIAGTEPEKTTPQQPETPFDGPTEPATEKTAADQEQFRARGKKGQAQNFWEAVQEIPKELWGQTRRAYIYIYQNQPFNTLKSEGSPGYLMKHYEPLDAQTIMEQYGSGVYYLMLKSRPLNENKDKLNADLTFEVYNPQYPPKLAREFWTKDPRNEKWVAMLPKEPPAPQMSHGLGTSNAGIRYLQPDSRVR